MAAFRGIHLALVGLLVAGCTSSLGGNGTSAARGSTATSSRPAPTSAGRSAGSTAPPSSAPAGASLAQALQVVRAHHYTPADQTPPWYPRHMLNAIVGYPSDTADGHSQFAFFFVGDKYIGTDTSDPSIGMQFVSGTDTTVTVKYFLYRSADPLCCPTGGTASVRYEWDGHKLVALDPIPPLAGSKHR